MTTLYLGDGVYATLGAGLYRVVITTGHHNPDTADNIVYIEEGMLKTLVKACIADKILTIEELQS